MPANPWMTVPENWVKSEANHFSPIIDKPFTGLIPPKISEAFHNTSKNDSFLKQVISKIRIPGENSKISIPDKKRLKFSLL
jgi:hypothetical protein